MTFERTKLLKFEVQDALDILPLLQVRYNYTVDVTVLDTVDDPSSQVPCSSRPINLIIIGEHLVIEQIGSFQMVFSAL